LGDIFKHFIDLIKDKTTSWGFKTALFISVIGLIFVADFYLGFSYNYHLNNKIEQLESISNLKKNYQNDSLIFVGLSKMERKVFYKKHYSDELSRLFFKDSMKYETSKIIDQNNPANNKPTTITKKPIRSIYWMTFTSNYLFVIILPFLIFLPLYSKDGRKSNAIVGWFASLIMFGIFGAITTWIAYQIPIIWNNPIWNYSLNFLIHTLFWVMVVKLGNDKNKKN
jgi:fluoride ion exporter CrcB/FEX